MRTAAGNLDECVVCALMAKDYEIVRDAFPNTRVHRDARIPHSVVTVDLASALETSGIETFGQLSSRGIGQLVSRVGPELAAEAVHACYWISPSSEHLFDWVGLVTDLLDLSDGRFARILRARSYQNPDGRRFTGRGSSITIGSELGLSSTRISQLGTAAWSDLSERIGDHRFLIYQCALTHVGPQLGSLWYPDALHLRPVLQDLLTVEPDLHIQQMGAYAFDAGWWHLRGTDSQPMMMKFKVRESTPASAAALEERLVAEGMSQEMVGPFLESIGELKPSGGILHWVNDDIGSRAAWVLEQVGEPLEMFDLLSATEETRGARNAIQSDHRIVRVGRGRYGLRKWGSIEYNGLASAIRTSLDKAGGRIRLAELTEELVNRFGISPSSVAIYANGGEFATRSGVVQWRTEDDDGPDSRKPISLERQCFRTSRNKWALRVTVDSDVQRGSGRAAPLSWIEQFDLLNGAKKSIRLDGSDSLTLSRRSWQATIGSTRLVASRLGANEGDLLFFEPESADRATVTHIAESEIDLMAAIGCSGKALDPSVVAHALGSDDGSSWADVRALCRARGDEELLDMIPIDSVRDDPDDLASLLGLGL